MTMLRNSVICTAAVASLLAANTGVLAADYAFSTFLPPKHSAVAKGLAPLFEKLNQKAEESMNWTLYPGAQLFSDKATLDSVGKGIADGGLVVFSYNQSDLINSYVMTDLHMLGENALAANAAIFDTFYNDCPKCMKDFQKKNVVVVGGYSPGVYNMVCSRPLKEHADIAGLKIRTSGPTGRWVRELNAVPVSMGVAEIPEALSRGIIDCYIGAVSYIEQYKLEDSVEAIVDLPMGIYKGGAFIFNRDTWYERLSTEDRALIWREMPRAIADIMIEGYEVSDAKARENAASNGVTMMTGEGELRSMLDNFNAKELDVAAEAARERGVEDPKAIIDAYVRNLAKWEAIMDKIGTSPEAYAQALWDEIFGKVDPEKI